MKQKNEIWHKESWNDGFVNKRHERFVSMRDAVACLKQVFSLHPPSSVAEDLPLQMWWDRLMLSRNHNSVFNHRQACWRAHQRGFETAVSGESESCGRTCRCTYTLTSLSSRRSASRRLLFCFSFSLHFSLWVSGRKPVSDTEYIMWQTVIATVVELSTNDPQMLKQAGGSVLSLSFCLSWLFNSKQMGVWIELFICTLWTLGKKASASLENTKEGIH